MPLPDELRQIPAGWDEEGGVIQPGRAAHTARTGDQRQAQEFALLGAQRGGVAFPPQQLETQDIAVKSDLTLEVRHAVVDASDAGRGIDFCFVL